MAGGRAASALTEYPIRTIIRIIMTRQPFTIAFAKEVKDHFRAIDRKYHALVHSAIIEQLRFEPDRETRNRKPLQMPAPFKAGWELRFGPQNRFRAFYRIDSESHVVWIRAIGIKDRNRLVIGGEEVEL
jgi:hypothetical protein